MVTAEQLIESMKTLIEQGFSIKNHFKCRPSHWMSELTICYDDTFGPNYVVSSNVSGFHEFPTIDEAIDFYCALYYNIQNYAWMYKIADKRKLVEDTEDIEYYNVEKMEAFIASYQSFFEEDCPLSNCFKNDKALEIFELIEEDAREYDKHEEME